MAGSTTTPVLLPILQLPFKLEKMLKGGTASARPEMAPGATVVPAEVET
jgi:hypothetical protein